MSIDMKEAFEACEDEFLKFDRVDQQRSRRRDIHAFLLLTELVPSDRPVLGAASHDEVFLDVDVERLSEVATQEHIIELYRCGVRYDGEYDSLCMFV